MLKYLPSRGGRSSMAEHLTVDQVVEGSSPFAHPIYRANREVGSRIWGDLGSIYGAVEYNSD